MVTTQLAPPYPIFTDRDGSPLDAGYLYFGEANLNPESNPIQVYYDNALTQPAAQPLRTTNGYVMRNGSPALIYANAQFSVTVRNKKNELVIYSPVGYGILPGTSETGTDQMTYNQGSSGAVLRVLTSRLQDYVSVKDFGVAGDGVTDDTAALKAFFDHCILTGQSGYISAGTYMIQLGQLAFDNNHVDTKFPKIETDGHFSVKFKAISNSNAPFISITNGTAISGVGRFWQGGSLGGISFEPSSGSTSGLTSMHGLVLRGIVYTTFGYMRGDNLGGSTVYIDQKLFGGLNPDPYNVALCVFDGVEGNRNKQASFYNDNWNGFTGCSIGKIRAIENENGVFFGMGAGNRVDFISAGSCAGWGIGENAVITGGPSGRFSLGVAEFDDIQYGINASIGQNNNFGSARFVHRYNAGPLNPSGGYWPRTALKVGNPARSIASLYFEVIDRIEAGGTKADLGVFADFSNAGGNLSSVYIQRLIQDNAALGVVGEDLFINFNRSSSIRYISGRKPVIDTIEYNGGYIRSRNSGAVAIPNGGLGSASNWVAYDVQVEGDSTIYDASTYEYTAPATGTYRISAALNLALLAGNRVRMTIFRNGTSVLFRRDSYAVTANTECHTVEGSVYLEIGDTIKINADQNSGAPVSAIGPASAGDNYLIIERI